MTTSSWRWSPGSQMVEVRGQEWWQRGVNKHDSVVMICKMPQDYKEALHTPRGGQESHHSGSELSSKDWITFLRQRRRGKDPLGTWYSICKEAVVLRRAPCISVRFAMSCEGKGKTEEKSVGSNPWESLHWVGQKVHSGSAIGHDGKTRTNFLANPIYHLEVRT